jgi:hypothetical protein
MVSRRRMVSTGGGDPLTTHGALSRISYVGQRMESQAVSGPGH